MKKIFKATFIFSIVAVLCSFSFIIFWNSPVKGSVNTSNAAVRAWVFSKTDTFNTTISSGLFQIDNVKPGNYTLMVEGRPPYRNSVKPDIIVVDGQPTDVGVIEMQQ